MWGRSGHGLQNGLVRFLHFSLIGLGYERGWFWKSLRLPRDNHNRRNETNYEDSDEKGFPFWDMT